MHVQHRARFICDLYGMQGFSLLYLLQGIPKSLQQIMEPSSQSQTHSQASTSTLTTPVKIGELNVRCVSCCRQNQ